MSDDLVLAFMRARNAIQARNFHGHPWWCQHSEERCAIYCICCDASVPDLDSQGYANSAHAIRHERDCEAEAVERIIEGREAGR